ncbi:hypothetical protein J6590_054281 [Homalodisca vitripennis]|nr:hypothetical protein J6590_094222 [Homalodisca vitripennis]KAG8306152.1 hypothetical protein J6590_054281 [Homalodisca vitripennis]
MRQHRTGQSGDWRVKTSSCRLRIQLAEAVPAGARSGPNPADCAHLHCISRRGHSSYGPVDSSTCSVASEPGRLQGGCPEEAALPELSSR